MSCDEMREWEEVQKEVEEVIVESPVEVPPAPIIMEEIHVESHRMIDLEKLISGKPNLKKQEMGELLKRAAKKILKKYQPTHSQKDFKLLPVARTVSKEKSVNP